MYLDNTYCSPSCLFPSRQEATETIMKTIESYPDHDILIAMRNLGKETLLCEVALRFQEWIYVPEKFYSTLEILGAPNVFDCSNFSNRIRVVPFHKLSRRFVEKLNEKKQTIAILPTCLYVGIEARPYENDDNIVIVPYSDHSSFSELKEFVSFLKPKRIIPVVNGTSRGPFGMSIANRADMSVFSEFTDSQNSWTKKIEVPLSVQAYMENRTLQNNPMQQKGVKRKKKSASFAQPKKPKRGVMYDSPIASKQGTSPKKNTPNAKTAFPVPSLKTSTPSVQTARQNLFGGINKAALEELEGTKKANDTVEGDLVNCSIDKIDSVDNYPNQMTGIDANDNVAQSQGFQQMFESFEIQFDDSFKFHAVEEVLSDIIPYVDTCGIQAKNTARNPQVEEIHAGANNVDGVKEVSTTVGERANETDLENANHEQVDQIVPNSNIRTHHLLKSQLKESERKDSSDKNNCVEIWILDTQKHFMSVGVPEPGKKGKGKCKDAKNVNDNCSNVEEECVPESSENSENSECLLNGLAETLTPKTKRKDTPNPNNFKAVVSFSPSVSNKIDRAPRHELHQSLIENFLRPISDKDQNQTRSKYFPGRESKNNKRKTEPRKEKSKYFTDGNLETEDESSGVTPTKIVQEDMMVEESLIVVSSSSEYYSNDVDCSIDSDLLLTTEDEQVSMDKTTKTQILELSTVKKGVDNEVKSNRAQTRSNPKVKSLAPELTNTKQTGDKMEICVVSDEFQDSQSQGSTLTSYKTAEEESNFQARTTISAEEESNFQARTTISAEDKNRSQGRATKNDEDKNKSQARTTKNDEDKNKSQARTTNSAEDKNRSPPRGSSVSRKEDKENENTTKDWFLESLNLTPRRAYSADQTNSDTSPVMEETSYESEYNECTSTRCIQCELNVFRRVLLVNRRSNDKYTRLPKVFKANFVVKGINRRRMGTSDG